MLVPEHCHIVQIMEPQATSSFWEQQNIPFLTGAQGKVSYIPGNRKFWVQNQKIDPTNFEFISQFMKL